MLTPTKVDPRAWTAASIDAPSSWYYPLPDVCLAVFDRIRQDQRQTPQPLTAIHLPESVMSVCAQALQPVLAALETGRGFAIVEGPPGQRLAAQEAQLLYWIVGQGLGQPFVQNVQGTMLYDVLDTGQQVAQGARFSVTNYESSFHTDNSFGTDILDYVGLLCLQIAKSGGRSQVVSGIAVHDELRARHPDVLATLEAPFHIDRRGGFREGESPTIQFPIIHWRRQELLVRYLRYWIEAGHAKVGQPLTAAQAKALDVLDECLNRRELRAFQHIGILSLEFHVDKLSRPLL